MNSAVRIIILVVCVAGGAAAGLFLSQYAPLFGSPWEKGAGPWSDLKMHLISLHVTLFTVLGAVLGAVALKTTGKKAS